MTCDQVRDLLPAYVLGALERDEEAAVREHLVTCNLHAEAAELGGVVASLAETVDPVEPPADLRSRIMAAAAADLETRRSPAAVTDTLAADTTRPATVAPPRAMPAERRPRFQLSWGFALQAAAVIALVALGAWTVNLQNRLTGLEGDVAAARAYETAVSNVLTAAAEPDSHTVVLAAGPDAPFVSGGIAAIKSDGSVVMAVHDLDPTVGSEVYEAWVILAGADPIPIGDFAVASAGTASFSATATPATAGATIALTREPGPNATTPTGPIISLGTALGPTS
jgi:anti-sigma factor RsiW